jgi:hypothetical protein
MDTPTLATRLTKTSTRYIEDCDGPSLPMLDRMCVGKKNDGRCIVLITFRSRNGELDRNTIFIPTIPFSRSAEHLKIGVGEMPDLTFLSVLAEKFGEVRCCFSKPMTGVPHEAPRSFYRQDQWLPIRVNSLAV